MAWLLKNSKRLTVGLFIAASIGFLFSLCHYFDLFHTTQLRSSDFLFRATDASVEKEKDSRIVIVAIDDRSLQELGHILSWPRHYYARVIDALSESEARAIVFDILFPDASPDDDALAASIKDGGNVILPIFQTQFPPNTITATQMGRQDTFSRPLDILEDGAAAVGHANVSPDADGVVRRLRIAIPAEDKYEPALALAAVAAYLRRPEVIESSLEKDGLSFAGRFIATDDNGAMIINYVGNARGTGEKTDFETISFIDVLNEAVEPAFFRDKIVIIGTNASGLTDSFWTPLGREMNGVELHANAINTILEGNFLKPASNTVTITSIIMLAILCGFVVSILGILPAAITVAIIFVGYLLAAFSFFDSGVMFNMFYPPLTIASTFVAVNIYNVVSEQSERRQITRIFGCYVSPPVLDKILSNSGGNERKLGGDEHEVTILFADVRNFTGITDKTEPKELVNVLNIYLSIIINQVLNCGGIINKFGGDSVMAIWNAPIECEKHALLATEAAVNAQRSILERQAIEPDLLKMEFGIGINTGKALAGNMGSRERMEYSVIGNAVNLAARIAGIVPGSQVWVGENTYNRIKGNVVTMPLAPIRVKGKKAPIRVFQVMGFMPHFTEQPLRFSERARNILAKLSY